MPSPTPSPWRRESTAPIPPYLLAVSSPSYHKNFSRMLEAFAALPRDLKVELRIVGDSHAVFGQSDLATLAARDPRVKLLGRIDDAELARQYRQATAFVFPSLYEGFGIPPLEAQACGCPVISANTASMPEVLQDSVLYFDPYETPASPRRCAPSCRTHRSGSAPRQGPGQHPALQLADLGQQGLRPAGQRPGELLEDHGQGRLKRPQNNNSAIKNSWKRQATPWQARAAPRYP